MSRSVRRARGSRGLPDMVAVAAAPDGDHRCPPDDGRRGPRSSCCPSPSPATVQTYVIQVIADRTADARTLQYLLIVLIVGGVAGDRPVAGRRRVLRPAGARPDPRFAPPPARVRGRREPRAAHAAGRRPGQRRAPPAPPRPDVAAQRESLDDMKAETDHLTDLVESLLLLARADSGVIELERSRWTWPTSRPTALDRWARSPPSTGCILRLDAAPHAGRRRRPAPPPARHDPRRQRDPPQPAGQRRSRSSIRAAGRQAELSVDRPGPTASGRRTCATSSSASGAPPTRRQRRRRPGAGHRRLDRRAPRRHDRRSSPAGGGARFDVTLPAT